MFFLLILLLLFYKFLVFNVLSSNIFVAVLLALCTLIFFLLMTVAGLMIKRGSFPKSQSQLDFY